LEKFEKELSMKKTVLAVSLAILALAVPRLLAQEKEKSAGEAKPAQIEKPMTPLRVQVVFTEFENDKKISNLPYTFLVNADDRGARAAVRMGLKVPIETSSNTGVKQFQYQDVGTNLDGRAEKTEDGRFSLTLSVEKSSAYLPGANEKPASVGGNEISSAQPTIQLFRTQVNVLIRDGQTIQSTVATDPVTGHVLKVDVTLNVMK
jgi:acyl-CoA hydrolase